MQRISALALLPFVLILSGCASDITALRPATFGDIPIWRLQLIVETCDLPGASPDSEMRVTVDNRTPGPLSSDSRGVFLYGPAGNYERGSFRVYDIHVDPSTRRSGAPWIATLNDVRSIRIQPTVVGDSWCIASLKLLVNNPSDASPLDRSGNLQAAVSNYVLVDKAWPNGFWVRSDEYAVAVSDPNELMWRVYDVNFDVVAPESFLSLPLDPTEIERLGYGRLVTAIPVPRPIGSTDAPLAPIGFDLWTASFEPGGERSTGLTWVAIGEKSVEVVSEPEVTTGYEFARDFAENKFDAMFNVPVRMSYSVFAQILQGVLGDQIIRSAGDVAEWGGLYGDAYVETEIKDARTLRVDVDLNRAGRRQSGNNHIVLKFDLTISCDRATGTLSLTPSNPEVQAARITRVYTFGLALIAENRAEDSISGQLRSATFSIGCASPRFIGSGIFFL